MPDVNGVHANVREGVLEAARLLPAQEVVEHGDGGEGGSGKAARSRSAPSPPSREVIFPQLDGEMTGRKKVCEEKCWDRSRESLFAV